jgi:hypothetical protein
MTNSKHKKKKKKKKKKKRIFMSRAQVQSVGFYEQM